MIGSIQMDESQFYRNQLWTAPELLRMATRPINGTQKADVYSFAIILQEIMFRVAPYFIDSEPPQCMGSNYIFNSLTSTSVGTDFYPHMPILRAVAHTLRDIP